MACGIKEGIMAVEIERKFLVRGNQWQKLTTSEARVRQAYLASGQHSSTRVRITDNQKATVTIKSRRAALSRVEVECAVSVADAEQLMELREGGLIEKTRWTVPFGAHVWEVDVFSGDNAGLVIAEIELDDEREAFEQPSWLGIEVTGQGQYYNGSLARHPYGRWIATQSVLRAS